MAGRTESTAISSRSTPSSSPASCRAEVARGRARDRGERHPDPAPEPCLAGLPGRPVRPGLGRDRRARHSAATPRPRRRAPAAELEITVKRHPEGLVSNFLADHAEPGMVLGLSPAEGDFHLPHPRPDSILLIGAGSGITPLMAILRTLFARGLRPGPSRCSSTPPTPTARSTARSSTAWRPRTRASSCSAPTPGSRRRRARRPLQPGPPSPGRPLLRRSRDLRLRPARTARCRARNLGPTASSSGSTSRASCRPASLPVGEPGEGAIRFAGSDDRGPEQRRLGAGAGRGGRRPAAVRVAGWGSATPAPAASSAAPSRTCSPARPPPSPTRRSSSASRPPLSDLVIDL